MLEDIEQFKSVFNRPDLVEQVLAGKRVPEISAKDPYMKIGFDIQTENGDKIVHAGERVDLTFEISNEGKGRAAPSKLRIESELISKTLELDRFRPDETRTEKVSFNAPYDLENGTVQVVAKLQVAGNSLCSLEISLRTRAVLPPTFRLGFEIDDRPDGESQGDGNGVLAPGERAKLWITVENVGQGDAKGVSLTLSPVGVEPPFATPTLQIGDLQPGSSIRRKFILFVPSGVEKNDINATVQVLEARKIFDHIEKFYPEDYESGPVKNRPFGSCRIASDSKRAEDSQANISAGRSGERPMRIPIPESVSCRFRRIRLHVFGRSALREERFGVDQGDRRMSLGSSGR